MFIELDFENSIMADTSIKKMLINTEDVKGVTIREAVKGYAQGTKVYIMDIKHFEYGDLTMSSLVYDDKEDCYKEFNKLKAKLNHKSDHLNVGFTPLADQIIPNDTTIAAMKAAREGDLVTVGKADDLIDALSD